MSEQLFTNEQLLTMLKDWDHDMAICEPSVVHAAIVRTIKDLEQAIDQATVEQLMPTILEGLPNLFGGDLPYRLPNHLEDAFGIGENWTELTWGEMIDDMGAVEYTIHAEMTDQFKQVVNRQTYQDYKGSQMAFAQLFPLERLDEIRQWAKKVYGWDCDIDCRIVFCHDLTYDGIPDEEVHCAWGYLYVGPHVPKERDLPTKDQEWMLQCIKPVLPMNMDVAPYGDENTFLDWLVCGLGEWSCESETGNIADHKAEIEYIKSWWLAMTGTRMENIVISAVNESISIEDSDYEERRYFEFDINHDDIRAVYGHLELPKSEVDAILDWAEREDWTNMPQFLGWFGKTIEDEPVADCPVDSIMDSIQDLSGDQLDMLLERIHADYGIAMEHLA